MKWTIQTWIQLTGIIKKVSSIEQNSEHPIAKAIVNYAKENNIDLESVTDFKLIPGYGVFAKI